MKFMAERMGFEPMKESPLYTLSKRAPSSLGHLSGYLKKFLNLKELIKKTK